MHHENEPVEPAFAYLTMLESAEHGFFGGYLIISPWGRPLEFHCTAPVRPSRAQQILYGPTLRPYLLGEAIGPALLDKAKLTPQVILTDQAATLCLRSHVPIPIVLVIGPEEGLAADPPGMAAGQNHAATDSGASGSRPVDVVCSAGGLSSTSRLRVGGRELQLPSGFHPDRQRIVELLERLATQVDLAEPFERIHEAIREAQRIGGRGSEAHGQAA